VRQEVSLEEGFLADDGINLVIHVAIPGQVGQVKVRVSGRLTERTLHFDSELQNFFPYRLV
jgi:hypothetical protein